MKTTLITGALLLSAMLLNAQDGQKKTTVRIKKVENINGVQKITDTTYTTDDPKMIVLGDDHAEIKEITGKDGKPCKMTIVTSGPDIELTDENGKVSTIILNSDGPDKGPVIKQVTTDASGKKTEKVMQVSINGALTDEEEKAMLEAAKNGQMESSIVISEDMKDSDGKKEVKVTRVIVMRDIKITEPSAAESQALGKSTGLSDNKLDLGGMKFYPNPNNGKFNLSFDLKEKGNTEVAVMNLEGKVIYSEKLNGFTGAYDKEIDISKNPKGVYFVKVSQGKHAQLKKIVLE